MPRLSGGLPMRDRRRKSRRRRMKRRSELSPRHCEERSDEAIHSFFTLRDGLLRCARNDGDRATPYPLLFTRLGILDVELAHRARDHEIVVVYHQRAGDAVLEQLALLRVIRRLLAV